MPELVKGAGLRSAAKNMRMGSSPIRAYPHIELTHLTETQAEAPFCLMHPKIKDELLFFA